jgi:hypothetical protein
MKYNLLFLSLILFVTFAAHSQEEKNIDMSRLIKEFKKDDRTQVLREDYYNVYKSESISTLDLLQALELNGINIFKFSFGEFDKKYKIDINLEEYAEGVLKCSSNLLEIDNEYEYFDEDGIKGYKDYFNQIKLITKKEDKNYILKVSTYKGEVTTKLGYTKAKENQFYSIRCYTSTKWKLNKKIPLMVIASSWEGVSGRQEFRSAPTLYCDRVANDLLSSTPHYYLISYSVTEIISD